MDAVFTVPEPRNEPLRAYAPDGAERASLQRRLAELARHLRHGLALHVLHDEDGLLFTPRVVSSHAGIVGRPAARAD